MSLSNILIITKVNLIKNIFLTIWQIPQVIVGYALVFWFMLKGNIEVLANSNVGCTMYKSYYMSGSISLGQVIILSECHSTNCFVRLHELGHHKQSLMLGPLYLIIIGVPSLIHAWLWNPNSGKSYYDFYTEHWANKLSKIELK